MISVVIPAFNEEESLGRCLESLAKQTTSQSFEVVVVDNNSSDKTKETVESHQDKLNLKVILQKKPGRGAARYLGFKIAQGEIIASTDADTQVPPDWLAQMVDSLKNKKIVAVTGPCQINDCSWRTNRFFNYLQPCMMFLYRIIFGHFWLIGSNFAIKKSAYQKAGEFDQEMKALEDIELGFRVKRIGKIKFINLPVVTSGRRMSKSFFRGMISYLKVFVGYFLFQQKGVDLSDV